MTAIPKISAVFETSLSAALNDDDDTTFSLVSNEDRDGDELDGLYGFVIDEGSADEEFIVGTVSDNQVTIVLRGLDADDPLNDSSDRMHTHRRGASVKITDYPILGYLRNILNAEEGYTLPNPLRYDSNVEISDDYDIPSKKYVDDSMASGVADANDTTAGKVERATQAEIEAGDDEGGSGAALFVAANRLGARLYYGYAADAGANDTYVITLSPVPTAYTAGMVIVFKANTINTGPATINVNSLGAKDIRKNNGLVLSNGDIQASQFTTLVYNGTYFDLQSPIGKAQVSQSGEEIYAADAGSTDTYAITVSPVPAAYVTGQVFRFKANTVNTGAATLNVNSLGAKSILRSDGSALANGDIAANQLVEVIYDGTNFLLLSAVANSPKYANGVTSRDMSTASGNQTIAHGLGRAPRYIRVQTIFGAGTGGGGDGQNVSTGTYNGTTTATVYFSRNNSSDFIGSDTTNIIHLYSNVTGGYQVATVTVDATNITLAWTKNGSPTGTAHILWEAQA